MQKINLHEQIRKAFNARNYPQQQKGAQELEYNTDTVIEVIAKIPVLSAHLLNTIDYLGDIWEEIDKTLKTSGLSTFAVEELQNIRQEMFDGIMILNKIQWHFINTDNAVKKYLQTYDVDLVLLDKWQLGAVPPKNARHDLDAVPENNIHVLYPDS